MFISFFISYLKGTLFSVPYFCSLASPALRKAQFLSLCWWHAAMCVPLTCCSSVYSQQFSPQWVHPFHAGSFYLKGAPKARSIWHFGLYSISSVVCCKSHNLSPFSHMYSSEGIWGMSLVSILSSSSFQQAEFYFQNIMWDWKLQALPQHMFCFACLKKKKKAFQFKFKSSSTWIIFYLLKNISQIMTNVLLNHSSKLCFLQQI